MNDLFANPEIVRWAATIAATALLAGLGAAGVALGIKLSAHQISQARAGWGMFRAELLPGIIKQVDEPGDPWIVALDKFIPGYAAPVMAATLPAFLRILADKAEEQLHTAIEKPASGQTMILTVDSKPFAEVNIGGAAK